MKETIDIHFHLSGVQNAEDIYLSTATKMRSAFVLYDVLLLASQGKVSNEAALTFAVDAVNSSTEVQRVVALALDGIYKSKDAPSARVEMDRDRTQYWVSNDFVEQQCRESSGRMMFGASVNPNRDDALDELKKVCEQKAVLIKLIPSVQDIDFKDGCETKKFKDYFEKMAEYKIPLLCHVGTEHTIPCADNDEDKQELNGVDKLEAVLRLEKKPKIIAAHCAAPIYRKDDRKSFDRLKALMNNKEYEDCLYADLSASFPFYFATKKEYLEDIKTNFPAERLIFGTDFPVPPFPVLGRYPENLDFGDIIKGLLQTNWLDRNVELIKEFGFSDSVFTNANQVLPA